MAISTVYLTRVVPRPRGRGDWTTVSRLLVLLDLGLQPLFLFPEFGRELGPEFLNFEHLADLDLGLRAGRVRAALHPVDGLLLRLALPQPEPGDQLLGLGERPVDHDPLVAR